MAKITNFGPHGHHFEEEKAELVKGHFEETNWPKPKRRMRFIYDRPDLTLDQMYYHLLDSLRENMGFYDIRKITDVLSASEQSGVWQSSAQRLASQQEKAAQYLQSIGSLTKQLFQIVKEVRALNERISLYDQTMDEKTKRMLPRPSQSAEIALKGYWVDLVQGGVKNPASVLGMGRELGYAIIPDLFFGAPVMNKEDIDKYVGKLEFNRKIREILARHLNNFYIWKESTYEELVVRRRFTLKYLRQHYNTIRMYITWIKPYLRNIRRLSLDTRKTESPDLLSAFEGAIIESELLAVKKVNGTENAFSCISVHMLFRSRAVMESMGPQSGYKQAPIYSGRADITIRVYPWTKEHIEEFMRFKEKDDLDMIASIDESLQSAIESLGKEFEDYLKASEGKLNLSQKYYGLGDIKSHDDQGDSHGGNGNDNHGYGDEGHGDSHGDSYGDSHVKVPSMFGLFVSPIKGIYELFVPMSKIKKHINEERGEYTHPTKQQEFDTKNELDKAESRVDGDFYVYVKLFKKKWKIPY